VRRSAHGRRTSGGVALLAALAAILAGCGGSGHRRATGATVAERGALAVASQPNPAPRRLPHGVAALRIALEREFAKTGPGSGGAVYDLSDGTSLFALRAGIARPPASVEKLYTSVAVLSDLGPSATLQTKVVGAGHLGAGGVWHGDLYLVGGGDPTLGDGGFNRAWEDGYGPTAAQLAGQIEARGIRSVSGRLIGDGSIFDDRRGPPSSGFAPDVGDLGGQLGGLTYDHGAATAKLSPEAFAAHELALTLRARHVAVRASRAAAAAPVGARELAVVFSPPMSVLLRLMDVPSDDFFAEMLTKQLGLRFGAGGGTTAAGAQVISEAIASFGLHPQIVDGSGLSRSDRSSPDQVVSLLRTVQATPTGRELDASLPVVGVSGTVQRIATHTAARGACAAKTGTLNGVTNLAGWCHSHGGKLLAFALFIDGPPNWRALELISAMVTSIARF
jgi:serine-type D-Ala-D-Ala carboxypeptidase/endopeptidase (penicillin-binding protein 4)